ncbi:MAG TPA: DUF58 domain-containing protein [Mycobacteriales bacterium]|nr:DUF58 domain-containing protein [Mycobacteriales bacterium]
MPDERPAEAGLARIRRLPRPTRATTLLLTIAATLEVLGQLINSTGVAIAAAAAVGAVISDAFLAPRVTFAQVHRRTPPRMAVGVPAKVELAVVGSGKRVSGRRPVVLIDRAPGLELGRYVIPSIRAGERAVADRAAMPLYRGHWEHGGRVEIEAFSPLGGWVRRNRVPIADAVWVHPAPAVPLRLPEVSTGEIYGRTSMARSGSGHDFYGIREWRPGDATTAVHWRASARRNQLVVMERERPGHPTLVVVVSPFAEGEESEQLLARVAATAVQALRDGRGVVLVAESTADAVTRPIDVLDWFAALDPARDPDGMRRAMQLAGTGAGVVWFGAGPLPPHLAAAARAAGAGSVSAARTLAGAAR